MTDFAASAGRLWRPFPGNREGQASIEFALVIPVLLVCLFLTVEVGNAIVTSSKTARAASAVGDLVAQQQRTSASDLDAIMEIGKAILQPYGRSKPTIVVTGIQISDNSEATIVWSRKLVGDESSKDALAGQPTTVPQHLNTKGAFLVRATADLDYSALMRWTGSETDREAAGLGILDRILKDGVMELKETYYLRPRYAQALACSDC